MFKVNALFLCFLILLGGCASKTTVRSQVEDVLKENPQLIFEVLEQNNVQLLEIVERGIDKREKQARKMQFEKELNNPFKPKLDLARLELGNPDAPVTVVEYSDFLCPYCSKANSMINAMVKNHPDKYRLFYKHLPLHKNSRKIAMIYEAIASIDHGKAFKFKNYVFSHQAKFREKNIDMALSQAVLETGIDSKALQQSLTSKELSSIVRQDVAEADSFGLDATPTFLVNGVTIRGFVSAKQFDDIVTTILEKGKKAEDDGEVCEDCLNKM
ncbi:DsbA family protein [Maridesulfovibrio bastinii]|uniref:DsbA family protein n=1 Tax=Maridesulfovibrio bastinii TaxID=47157 RepID=UPI0004847509|nr:thioredoxin domain-containing protein [Maridesulfovibrio bastinii]